LINDSHGIGVAANVGGVGLARGDRESGLAGDGELGNGLIIVLSSIYTISLVWTGDCNRSTDHSPLQQQLL
jgi:hypothetical protein